MHIGIIGYGKMGKAIEAIALQRGHTIVFATNDTPDIEIIQKAQVCIEFTQPDAAATNIRACATAHTPIVCGTTGWHSQKEELEQWVREQNSALLHTTNFSLGVNLFFRLNEQLAEWMAAYMQSYTATMEETHHTQKKDAPSGTALTLAAGIMQHLPYTHWHLGDTQGHTLGIYAKRENDVPGTHIVRYQSEVDEIELKHTAHNRTGFALGAVIAAEWIVGKQGIFSMKDVLF